ncbi:hypothetical protein GCM10022415_32190 [Knoellia locipacati]|uniref:Uncharacterized protein n=1 Tax=Knoellia locipacati TaxID=882824 RepID=A0A512T3K1_9MICO|nr:hypothetical protein [Knoellia locipacati]GEQ14777.1 hypothetical protein KLO01_28240 [Knoellia locipacati]
MLLRRLLSLAAATAVGAAALTGAAAPAQAAACSSTSGVTVVVQSSNGTSVRCASGDPGSAWGALQSAGFSLTAVQRFPDALCRIDGFPKSDPCVNMPPASAYWSFWHAPNGGSWTYSQIGIKGWDPKPGSSVGFRFGSGTAPGTQPATVSAPKPTTAAPRPTTAAPKPTPRRATTAPNTPRSTTQAPSGRTTAPPATSGAAGATRAPNAAPGTTPTPGAASPTASPTPSTPSSASPSATGEPSASASESSSDAVAAGPTDGRSSDGSGGSGTARLLGGGALLAGLASAVAFVGLRRRQAQTSV